MFSFTVHYTIDIEQLLMDLFPILRTEFTVARLSK